MRKELLPVSLKFIRDVLESDEKIVVGRRLHWIYLMNGFGWLIFFWGIALIAHYVSYLYDNPSFYITKFGYIAFSDKVPEIFAIICFFAGALIFLTDFVKYKTTAVLLTNKRLIYKVGFVRVKIDETDLSDIRGIHVDQGWLGYFLNYGKLCLDCRFIEDVYLPCIKKPYSFVKIMHKMRSDAIEEEATVRIINDTLPEGTTKLKMAAKDKL